LPRNRIANSGSYFAVNNVKTKYFFASMVFTIDIILSVGSHQAAMHAVLNELSSLYGLRIKTLQKENEQLPSTFHTLGGRAAFATVYSLSPRPPFLACLKSASISTVDIPS
jgi:hypothetical protein